MKARDHAAFVAFVADDAVFFNGPAPLHGKKRWATSGKSSTTSLAAPFSWEPDQVEVLASGKLAASSGPELQPRGQADRALQFDLAPRSIGQVEDRVRQGRGPVRLQEARALMRR
ncbi:hypothetical protein LP420_00875 [Massilia sp. B-10]|nr:hypothetical protein LP420_00875 [Massilia sp. B-10]